MPLSEDEQRILHEIEHRFYEHDPEYAKSISTTTLYRALGRNCKWAAAAFTAGLIVLLVSFASSWVFGAIGFAVMLVAAVAFAQNLRKMGRAGWEQMTQQMRSRSLNDVTQNLRTKLNERFKRD